MYTKEQLQAISDFEVNKALEKITGMYCEDCEGKYIRTMDYCNTPNDIMPLAFEHKINLMWDAVLKRWGAMKVEHFLFDTNPLRAIACCLILVLQERDK